MERSASRRHDERQFSHPTARAGGSACKNVGHEHPQADAGGYGNKGGDVYGTGSDVLGASGEWLFSWEPRPASGSIAVLSASAAHTALMAGVSHSQLPVGRRSHKPTLMTDAVAAKWTRGLALAPTRLGSPRAAVRKRRGNPGNWKGSLMSPASASEALPIGEASPGPHCPQSAGSVQRACRGCPDRYANSCCLARSRNR